MEQDGSGPQQSTPENQKPDAPSGPSSATADRRHRTLLAGGVLAVVGLLTVVGLSVGGGSLTAPPDASDPGITLPSGGTAATTAPDTTDASTTVPDPTAAPTSASTTSTVPPTTSTTVAPTSTPTSPASTATPTSGSSGRPATGNPGSSTTTTIPAGAPSIETIVPDIAAFRRHLATPQQVQAAIDRMLREGGRHDVARGGTIATLCATVVLDGPIELSGRWERDAEEIASTGDVLRSAPGFGDCIDNDGEPLEAGSYQYLATDTDGTESPVANFVVGAARIQQTFVNNGEEPVCVILVAPITSDYFEDYGFDPPLPPRARVTIPLADVMQDVEVRGCQAGAEQLADFDFDPSGTAQDLSP